MVESVFYSHRKRNPLAASGIPLAASGIFLTRQTIANFMKQKKIKKKVFPANLGYVCLDMIRLEKFA